MADLVNHPSHYNQNGVETIDIIEAALTPEEFRGFLKGNIIKYLDRHKYKNGQQDLEKAQWYSKKLYEKTKKGLFDKLPESFRKAVFGCYFVNQSKYKQSAIKHWEEYRNELSKDL